MADEKAAPPQQGRNVETELASLRAEIKSMRATLPTSLIAWHGAGPEDTVEETWSLAEQEAARAE
jgi:hypothetical protein